MSIDPRIMTEMLRLQMLNSVDFFSSGATDSENGSGVDFSWILQQLLGQADDTSSDTAASGTVVPKLIPLGAYSSGSGVSFANTASALAAKSVSSSPSSYDSLIEAAGERYGVDPQLIKSVIRTESGFDNDSVSGAGAKGLMQLMDGTARSLGVNDSFDPEQNINGGTKFLSYLLNKYNGSERIALAAYNAGPGRVDRLGITNESELDEKYSQLPKETQRYILKVLGS